MQTNFDEAQAEVELEKGYAEAEEILKDPDKFERFLQRLEKKLKAVPLAGEKLAHLPVMASLVKSYVTKEYTDIPMASILATVSALMYFVSPIDIIPDNIPGIGHLDDAGVIAVCWAFIETDIDAYQNWRQNNGKVMDM